jgi:hypothetical protein
MNLVNALKKSRGSGIARSPVKGVGRCSSGSHSEVGFGNVAAKRVERQRARSVHLYRDWDLRFKVDEPHGQPCAEIRGLALKYCGAEWC